MLGNEQPLNAVEIEIAGAPTRVFGSHDDPDLAHVGLHAAQLSALASAIERLPEGPAVMFDIGARLGLASVLAARLLPQGRVIAVEPAVSRYRGLQQTIARNGISNCRTMQFAVGAHHAFAAAAVQPRSGDLALGADRGTGDPHRVFCTTVDSLATLLNLPRIDLIRIEASGREMAALEGATRTIERFRPVFVVQNQPYAVVKNGGGAPHAVARFALERFGRLEAHGPDGVWIIASVNDLNAHRARHDSQPGRIDQLVFR